MNIVYSSVQKLDPEKIHSFSDRKNATSFLAKKPRHLIKNYHQIQNDLYASIMKVNYRLKIKNGTL